MSLPPAGMSPLTSIAALPDSIATLPESAQTLPVAGMAASLGGIPAPLVWLAVPFVITLAAALVVPLGRRVRRARRTVTEEKRAARLRRALAGRQDTVA